MPFSLDCLASDVHALGQFRLDAHGIFLRGDDGLQPVAFCDAPPTFVILFRECPVIWEALPSNHLKAFRESIHESFWACDACDRHDAFASVG